MKNCIGIYFESKHSQTQKIANYLGQWFRELKTEVDIVDLAHMNKHTPDPLDFDAVLVGAPVYRTVIRAKLYSSCANTGKR